MSYVAKITFSGELVLDRITMKILFVLKTAILLYYTACCLHTAKAAKILAIFPFPGPSQYILVQPYLKALAAKGHEVSVISAFPQKQPINNFHDITIKNMLEDQQGKVRIISEND